MAKISEQNAIRLETPYAASYNFTITHTVVINHPLSDVFPVLAQGDNIRRSVLCHGCCSDFELLNADTVNTPSSAALSESRVRTLPSSQSGLPRQFFCFQETIQLLFGFVTKKVEVVGCQTWDEEAKVALQETVTNQRITMWKLRVMEEIPTTDGEGPKTKVTETVNGTCPSWMRLIVRREGTKGYT